MITATATSIESTIIAVNIYAFVGCYVFIIAGLLLLSTVNYGLVAAQRCAIHCGVFINHCCTCMAIILVSAFVVPHGTGLLASLAIAVTAMHTLKRGVGFTDTPVGCILMALRAPQCCPKHHCAPCPNMLSMKTSAEMYMNCTQVRGLKPCALPRATCCRYSFACVIMCSGCLLLCANYTRNASSCQQIRCNSLGPAREASSHLCVETVTNL